MNDLKLTAICTGSGALGGTMKATALTMLPGMITPEGVVDIVCYAVLSALAAYLSKRGLDRVDRRPPQE